MNLNEKIKMQKHYEKNFEQKCMGVWHPTREDIEIKIDVMVFEPTKKYPFWKLVTIGASDYVMPKKPKKLSKRNEYMIFLDKFIDIKNPKEVDWYYFVLIQTALLPFVEKGSLSFGHTIAFKQKEETEMNGVVILLPEIVENPKILTCNLGFFKKCSCLQVMPITKKELELSYKKGFNYLPELFYPLNSKKKKKYIAEKTRT